MKQLFLALLVGIFVVGVVFWWARAPLASWYLTRSFGVPISMQSLSLGREESSIGDFMLKNPPGFSSRTALEAGTIDLFYHWRDLFRDTIEFKNIEMDTVYIGVQFGGKGGNNWVAIGKEMPESSGKKHVILDRLLLTNIVIEIRGFGGKDNVIRKTVPRLELRNIDSEKGFPIKEVIRQIFGGSGLKEYLQDAFNPQKQLQRLLQPLLGEGNLSE